MKQILFSLLLLISIGAMAQPQKSMRSYTPRAPQMSDTTWTNQGTTGTSTWQQLFNLFGIANKQPLEDQRLSTTNAPTFAGLTSNGLVKLIGQGATPAPPVSGTQNMYADSTGAWTIQGSNGFALSISKNRLTANHRIHIQNKDYTVADSADVAANAAATTANSSNINAYLVTSSIYTSGSTYTLPDNSSWVIINPSSTVSTLAVTMPANPKDGQREDFSFGGTITSGTVVTSFSVIGNTGQGVIQSTAPASVQAGETISYRFNISLLKWYRIL